MLQNVVALRPRERKKVHIGIIHAHQLHESLGLLRIERVGIEPPIDKKATGHVEKCASAIVAQIWEKTKRMRQFYQKNKVKIGRTTLRFVENDDRTAHKIEQLLIDRRLAQRTVEKFAQKERHTVFGWVGGNALQQHIGRTFAQKLKLAIWTNIDKRIDERERLHQHGRERRTTPLPFHQTGQHAVTSREKAHNVATFAVAKCL